MKKSLILIALAAVVSFSSAKAQIFEWTWDGTDVYDSSGGTIESLSASFNSINNEFGWDVTFGPNSFNQVTKGFTVAVNNGPNPKGEKDLALLYFDFSNVLSPQVTAYEYSGINNLNSYLTEPVIHTATDTSWIKTYTVTENFLDRTVTFLADATTINGFNITPDWTGVAFDEHIGLWFHPVVGLQTTYDGDGSLTGYHFNKQGWLDLNDKPTDVIPEPGSVLLIATAGLLFQVRRRRRYPEVGEHPQMFEASFRSGCLHNAVDFLLTNGEHSRSS